VYDNVSRRRLLGLSAGLAAAAGLSVAGPVISPAAASAPAGGHPELPDVPGMLGNRLANEFWYQFDEVFLFSRDAEIQAAINEIVEYTGTSGEGDLYHTWLGLVTSPGYPRTFLDFMAPVAEPLRLLSRRQLAVVDTYYRRSGGARLDQAFADFGQGVLYDPRRLDVESPVHTMDGDPPIGYHLWYVFQRAMMLLDIDARRWRGIAPRVALAWAVQSEARPSPTTVNPPLPARTLRRLKARWLPRSVRQLDVDFQSLPYPSTTGD
jgi:hypothetical protein